MRRGKSLRSMAVAGTLLTSLGVLAGCGGGSAGDSDEAIKVALINPTTGTAAQYGQDLLRGQKLAIEKINADGGVLGRDIEPIEYDDQNLPEQGVTLARRAITQDGVKFVVGTNGSSVAMAVRNVTQASEVLYLVGTTKGPTVTDEEHDFVFRLNSTPEMDAEFLYPYADKVLDPQVVATIQEQSDYGLALNETTKSYFGDRMKGTVVTQLTTTNFSPFISKIADLDPDVVFMANGGSTSAMAASLDQMAEAGLDVPKIFPPGSVNQTLLELAGARAVEGAIYADIYAPSLENETNQEFVKAYVEEYDSQPSVQAAIGYEQILILAAAIEDADTADDTAKVRDAMRSGTFDTPRGEVTFNEIGQAIPSEGLIPLRIENGEVVLNDQAAGQDGDKSGNEG